MLDDGYVSPLTSLNGQGLTTLNEHLAKANDGFVRVNDRLVSLNDGQGLTSVNDAFAKLC